MVFILIVYYTNLSHEKNPKYHFQIYEIVASTNFFDDSDLSIFKLAKKPVFTEKDLVSYNWVNHTFQFKGLFHNKTSEIKTLGEGFRAFVIVANGERICIGSFYNLDNSPNIYLTTSSNGGEFHYKGASGFDKRNDDRIREALKNAEILQDGLITVPLFAERKG